MCGSRPRTEKSKDLLDQRVEELRWGARYGARELCVGQKAKWRSKL